MGSQTGAPHSMNEANGVEEMNTIRETLEGDQQYREQTIEYMFLSDLTRCLASAGKKLEILKPHTDAFGYDLVLKVDKNLKYVQLKSVKETGKATRWDVHKSLLEHKSGTVILIIIDYTGLGLKLKYRVLDNKRRDEVLAKPPKRKRDKKKYCMVTIGTLLYPPMDINEVASELFKVSLKAMSAP